ncbi:hypothetical protein V0288_03835, partial [Pannus brasiliensis CCIBt3594]
MNIGDILIGFVGGGAIGGGVLYALKQGKITELTKQFDKARSALDETESELQDTKGRLEQSRRESEARIRGIEGTYREEVAKLQRELDETRFNLQEMTDSAPSEDLEASYEARIEELRREYERQLEEAHQAQQFQPLETAGGYPPEVETFQQDYSSPEGEWQDTASAFVDEDESPFLEEEGRAPQFAEPWDDLPDTPRDEFGEIPVDTSRWEEFSPPVPELSDEEESLPELDFLESLHPETPDASIENFQPETEAFATFGRFEETSDETEAFGNFSEYEESAADMSGFGEMTVIQPPAAEFSPETSAYEGFGGFEETSDETEAFGTFDGFQDSETLEPQAEFSPETSAY